jgi:phage replication-related protein YjqB (UPF0714/DUF867 family)
MLLRVGDQREEGFVGTYSVSVKKALLSQQDLINDGEHCSADPDRLRQVGRDVGQQVRIKRNSTQHDALYTVSEPRQESPDNFVRMGATGRQRLGTSEEFSGTLDSRVPRSSSYPTDDQAKAANEFVERRADNGTHKGLIVIAPHGGQIEPHTDEQAERVAARLATKGVSSWRCKGWNQGGGAHERWHITSVDIHPASFPLLNTVISRHFTYAVAFHGSSRQDIVIGGGPAAGALKSTIQKAVQTVISGSNIKVLIAQANSGYEGDSKRNIVNRLTAGGENGIQIEQSSSARENYGQAIADAVANVYKSKLS